MKSREVKAVEMVREIRDEQYEALQHMTPEERRDFFRKEAEKLHRKLRAKKKSVTS